MKYKEKLFSFFSKYDSWLITLLAFLLRIPGIQSMSYESNGEFYRDYYASSLMAAGKRFLYQGPPSILGGLHFGPIYYYLLTPFLWIFRMHPQGLIFAAMLISSLSVFAFYHLLKIWFDSKDAARAGALLCALSMYSVFIAEYLSNPNFLPLFVIWFFYCLTKFMKGNISKWNFLWMGVSYGVASQLHPTALLVLSAVFLLAVIWKYKNLKFKQLWISLLGVLAIYSTYIYYEFAKRFSDLKRLASLGESKLTLGSHSESGMQTIWNFLLSTIYPSNNPHYAFTYLFPNWLNLFVVAAALAFAYILIRSFVKKEKSQKLSIQKNDFENKTPCLNPEALFIFLTWIISTMIMLLAYKKFVRYYYVIVLWPAPLVALLCLGYWLKKKFGIFRSFVGMLAIFYILEIISFYYSIQHVPWSNFKSEYVQAVQTTNMLEIGSPHNLKSFEN